MKNFVDFHVHTHYSDGEDSPAKVIDLAMAAELKSIAITDHGTVKGITEASEHSRGRIEVIPGIELSCDEPLLDVVDIHILGLFIDPRNKFLERWIQEAKEKSKAHKEAIIKKLNSLGFAITFAEAAMFTKGEVGRPHIAKALLTKYPRHFSSVRHIFDEYLIEGKKAYVPANHRTTMEPVIQLIHRAGGIAILAHPGYFDKAKFKKVIALFVKQGGDGIEAYYVYDKLRFPSSSSQINQFFRSLAQKRGLTVSGGSDYHGSFKPVKIGDAKVPYAVLPFLQEKAERYK